jgi:hypothetical protein
MVKKMTDDIDKDLWKSVVSKEDWQEIKKRLSMLHPIRFIIDGYRVMIHLVKVKMRVVIVPMINGEYDALKWEKEESEIPDKFYQPKEKWMYPKKTRNTVIKKLGKKEAEKHGFLKKIKYIQYHWTNFGAMKRHYMKTCRSIQVCKADVEHQSFLGRIGEAFNV